MNDALEPSTIRRAVTLVHVLAALALVGVVAMVVVLLQGGEPFREAVFAVVSAVASFALALWVRNERAWITASS
jgi:hypothetical protein